MHLASIQSLFSKKMEFSTAVRGFHYYQSYWQPTKNERLDYSHEKENPCNYFPIKTCCKTDWEIVGHFPMEIPRPTKFLLNTNNCDTDVNIVLRIPSCTGRPRNTFFG